MLFQSVEVHYVCRHRRRVTIKAAPCPAEVPTDGVSTQECPDGAQMNGRRRLGVRRGDRRPARVRGDTTDCR